MLAGHLVKVVRIPEVTGYILAGIALGPSILGWVSAENLLALEVLSEVALGLILFSIGSVFEFSRFRRLDRQFLNLTLVESALAAALVTIGVLMLGQPWQVALLLGAIAIATAPASTLMVIRECDSSGPLTENLLGIIAVNNLFCITAYAGAAAAIDLASGLGGRSLFDAVYLAAYPLIWQLLGSAAWGYLVGMLLAGWATRVRETGEMLILLAGSILFCVGVSRLLDLSPLVASLAVGATMVNLSGGTRVRETGEMLILLAGSILFCVGVSRLLDLSPLVASLAVGATMVNLSGGSRRLFETLSGTDPPLYAIFFVLAGADLDLALVPAMGVVGLVYVAGRSLGKFAGAAAGARWLQLEPSVQRFLGFGLLAQAGLAVGLTLQIEGRYEAYAASVSTVVLASVAIFEMFGPISTRFALMGAGEAEAAHRHPAPAQGAD